MLLLLAMACPRQVDPLLELHPVQAVAETEPTDAVALRRWMIRGDPLARRTRPPTGTPPDDPGLAAWLAQFAPTAEAWWRLEREARGTVAVPLARGARLSAMEAEGGQADTGGGERLLAWLLPLPAGEAVDPNAVRPVWNWLLRDTLLPELSPTPFLDPREPPPHTPAQAPPPRVDREALLGVAERAVLLGWLDSPTLAVDAWLGGTLDSPAWDRLMSRPAARILRARLAGMAGGPPTIGRVDGLAPLMATATRLAVVEAAADRDVEQTAAARERTPVLAAHPGAQDAVAALLHDALPLAIEAAAHDPACGYGLIAIAALRWREVCGDAPCGGLDRLDGFDAAARFGAEPAALAAAWRALVWKEGTDRLYAAWERVVVTEAMDRITELIAHDDPRALDRRLLLHTQPDATVILGWSRALAGRDETTRDALFPLLYARVAREARAAAALNPELEEPLFRIATRSERFAQGPPKR